MSGYCRLSTVVSLPVVATLGGEENPGGPARSDENDNSTVASSPQRQLDFDVRLCLGDTSWSGGA